MEIKITELVKAAGYKSTDYQRVLGLLRMSEKYKNTMRSTTFKGDVVEGEMNELISELKKMEILSVEKAKEKELEKKKKIAAQSGGKEFVYDLSGVRGRSIRVFDDRAIIKVDPTAGALLTGNGSDGTKVIFYKDVIGIQFKESKFAIGYLQLETASGLMNNCKDNMFNENTFTFDVSTKGNPNNETMKDVFNYIINRVSLFKQLQIQSAADEILKFKQLLDDGVITIEEFEKKKKQLLSL